MGRHPDDSWINLESDFRRLSEIGKVDDDGLQELAEAIVVQAVDDLRDTTRWLRRHPDVHDYDKRDIEKLNHEVKEFFRSDWFTMIVDVVNVGDGSRVIEYIQRSAG